MTGPGARRRRPGRYRRVELEHGRPVLRTYSLPERPGGDTMVVRPSVVGVCRADLKELQGLRPRRDFGHEIVATVEWAPDGVRRRRGDLVCFNPHARVERSSGFAELMVARGVPAQLESAFPLVPAELSPRKLVACEPMACAAHAASALRERRAGRAAGLGGSRVAIIGAGIAGALIGLILRHLGAEVTLFNRGPDRLDLLRRRDIFADRELRLLGIPGRGDYDVVVAATSFLYEDVLRSSRSLVKPGGTVLLYGGTRAETVLPDHDLPLDAVRRRELDRVISWDGKPVTLAGCYGSLERDYAAACALLSQAPSAFPVERLITEEVTLEELPGVLRRLSRDETGHRGKVIAVLP